MEAKEYLRQSYKLNEKIKDKRERIKALKELSISLDTINHSKDRVQTSQVTDGSFVNQLATIDQLERELTEELIGLQNLICEISKAIDAVEDVDCALILSKRYLLMKHWDDIADDLGYSVSQLHRIHAKALNIFVVPEKMKCDGMECDIVF